MTFHWMTNAILSFVLKVNILEAFSLFYFLEQNHILIDRGIIFLVLVIYNFKDNSDTLEVYYVSCTSN